jgi:DNA-directed RNA polymerase subunit N (RpoN/RPB10)
MLNLKCPTCNRLLDDKSIPYKKGLKKICDDTTLTPEEINKKKAELVNSLGIPLHRPCCRAALMTYRELVNIVK